jgi:hypothetical protein
VNIKGAAIHWQLPEEQLRKFDGRDETDGTVSFAYHSLEKDVDGRRREIRRQHRRDVNQPGDEKWFWGDTVEDYEGPAFTPFGLSVHDPTVLPEIILVEGIGDVLTLDHAGIAANGLPGSQTFKDEFAPLYATCNVYLWREHRQSGDQLIRWVSAHLPDARVVHHPEYDDPNEMFKAEGPKALRTFIEQAKADAPLATDVIATEDWQAEYDRLIAEPGVVEIVESSDRIGDLRSAITHAGYAGPTYPVEATILAFTTRVCDEPMCVLLFGQSASGKSHSARVGFGFMPTEETILIQAGSAGSWVYRDDDYTHKAVLVAELDSLPQGDSAIASAVREFISSGRMYYETTRDTKDGRTLLTLDKGGPSAIVVTGTKIPERQTFTRTLPVPMRDNRDQIAAVSKLEIQKAAGNTTDFDLTPWQNYQRLISLWFRKPGRTVKILVPFLGVIDARSVEALKSAVRWNRDFPALRKAIEAVALLNWSDRLVDDGTIITITATVEDYQVVRDVLGPAIQMTGGEGLTQQARETWQDVSTNQGTFRADAAKRLKVVASTLSDRTAQLEKLGLLRIEKDGRRDRLYTVGELPEDTSLPDLSDLIGQAHLKNPPNDRMMGESVPEHDVDVVQPVFGDDNEASECSVHEEVKAAEQLTFGHSVDSDHEIPAAFRTVSDI